ncbi:DUF3592 domain-containing protein [Xanthobacteraceae bacterium A53D]
MRYLPLLFLLIGLLMLAVSGMLVWRTETFVAEAETAQGVVIDMERFRDSDCRNCYLYSPVVRFEARGGQEITFTTSWRSRPARYSRGERVEVLYPADNPQDAEIVGLMSLWGGSIITGILGLAFSFFGLLFMRIFRHEQPAPTGTVTRG